MTPWTVLVVQPQISAEPLLQKSPNDSLSGGKKAFPLPSPAHLPEEGSTVYFQAWTTYQKDPAQKGSSPVDRNPASTKRSSEFRLTRFNVESKGRDVDGRAWSGPGFLYGEPAPRETWNTPSL